VSPTNAISRSAKPPLDRKLELCSYKFFNNIKCGSNNFSLAARRRLVYGDGLGCVYFMVVKIFA